ncbi:MAG: hypothetical protein FWD84_05940, partial [Oscillospiraceae bacterium]|nr:hypothetical protein [Oscillospiraceae bacterium]
MNGVKVTRKTKAMALLLAILMLLTIFPPAALAVLAEGDGAAEMPNEATEAAQEDTAEPES